MVDGAEGFTIARKLYPNVDFYSGIIMKAIGIPVNMFTVMFATPALSSSSLSLRAEGRRERE